MKRVHLEGLKTGQVMVVVYSKGDLIMIVPNPAWDIKGDLTQIPVETRKILQHPRKNGVKRHKVVISESTRTNLVPSGKKVLDEIAERGYFESDRGVKIVESV
jgi:hypothetical protein